MVSADANAAFKAVTADVEQWWTRPDKALEQIGDKAKFGFPPLKSYWTFELTQVEKPKFVEWTCIDALHIHEGQPKEIQTEWLGTKVLWTISPNANGCEVELEHLGLQPDLLCYDICQAGWDMFFLGSLKAYLNTGQGSPHQGS